MGWIPTALGRLLHEVKRPVSVDPDSVYSEIGIRSHGRGIFHKEPIKGLELGNKKVFHIHPGDFVLNIVFAWEGAVAIAGDGERGRIGSHRFPTFLHDETIVDLRFLLHYFRTERGLALLLRVSPGGAGRNRSLSRQAFLRESVPLPSLEKQRKIVARLDRIESALRSIQAEFEDQDGLVEAALLRSVNGPRSTPFPRTPIATIARRADYLEKVVAGHSYPFAGALSFGRGLFNAGPKVAGRDFKYGSLVRLKRDHLVYPKLMAWEGAFAVVPEKFEDYFVSPEFVQFELTGIEPSVVDAWFRSELVLPEVKAASSGTNMRRRRLKPSAFMRLGMPFPDERSARLVHQIVILRDALAASREKRLHDISTLRTQALSQAFDERDG